MPEPLHVAIVGDRDDANPNHRATEQALAHSASALGLGVEAGWFATDRLVDPRVLEQLEACDGVWSTTGSPYRSLEGALAGIRLAREQGMPFLGTCGGFQHVVVEFARNVAGFAAASHGEYEGAGEDLVITPLECSLAGKSFDVDIDPGSRAAACYGATRARENYYCSYGIDAGRLGELLERGLPVVATADDGTPRILELPDHPFFVATLFVPQARSTEAEPHPLVSGFVRAASLRGR